MQLPDEVIEYDYRGLLVGSTDPWTPLAELQAQQFLTPERVESVKRVIEQVRGMVSGERELTNPPARLQPLQAGFIEGGVVVPLVRAPIDAAAGACDPVARFPRCVVRLWDAPRP